MQDFSYITLISQHMPRTYMVRIAQHTEFAILPQRTHDVMIKSLLRQNDVATSFWRYDDVTITSCVRWGAKLHVLWYCCVGFGGGWKMIFHFKWYHSRISWFLVEVTFIKSNHLIVVWSVFLRLRDIFRYKPISEVLCDTSMTWHGRHGLSNHRQPDCFWTVCSGQK